jgi:predicted Zn-dependent protease
MQGMILVPPHPEAAVFLTRFFLAALALLVAFTPAFAAAPPAQPLPSQIARWVEELGDDSFAVREEATKKLRAAGASAEARLEKAAGSRDPEVAKRAKGILADFRWGVYPETPERIVELIRRYQSSTRTEKRAVIQKLFASGAAGCRALVKISRAEEDPLVRKDVFSDMAASMIRGVPVLLEEGNLAALEGLLQLALEGDVKTGGAHYAAYHLLTGQAPKRIAELEKRAKDNPPGKVEAEILFYLYRARGDLKKAYKAAVDAEQNELQEGALYENADWKGLARHPELTDTRSWTRYVGTRAAYARLAGNTKAYETAIKDILDKAKPVAESKGNVMPYAKALFLNARPADALALLKKAEIQPRLRFDILVAQLNLKAAFEIVEAARKASSPELPGLEIAQARALYHAGEKDKALAVLKRYREQVKPGADADWFKDLVEAEVQIARADEAFADAAKVLAISTDGGWPGRLFEKLFPDQEEDALALWGLFRRVDPKQPTEKALARLRLLLEGKAGKPEVESLLLDAAKAPAPEALQRRREWLAAGEAALLCRQEARAAECFRKAGGLRSLIRLGDLMAARKQWPQAAARYLEAYRLSLKGGDEPRDREDDACLPALALFLHGHALVSAGQKDAGRKRIEQAHLLPLGSGEVRYHFSRALVKRRHKEEAQREHDLLRKLGDPVLADPDAFYTGEGLRAAAIAAATRKKYRAAADGYEQAFLRCLQPNLNFARAIAYVTVPAHIHRMRAEGLALAGNLDEAKAEALRSRIALPGNVELALRLVPLLDQKKRKKDADELFGATIEVYDALLVDHPKHAWAYNQAAWLSACCRRNLDKALAYARKAVALAPRAAGYQDTLAEVLFQLGKKDEAVAVQKKVVDLDPKREYFRKQLKRIQAGDPKAPRPDEGEE